MRQVEILIAPAKARDVLERSRDHRARATVLRHADPGNEADDRSLVSAQIPNDRVGAFISDVQRLADDAEVVVQPVGTLPLSSPLNDLEDQVHDVSRLSTFELVLGSLQSIGSWRGLLVYSALAGVIGAFGVVVNASYLLVAAMLINPMAAPALVSVIGTTIGDARMTGRGALRFVASLAVQTSSALLFGLAYGLSASTAMMEQVTSLSVWSALLALAAGAAGAQTLVKSDRDSLITGTAAGFMVAAALAPPAAVLGLSVPLGRWDYATPMLLLLGLQYAAILVGGSITLALNGVRPSDPTLSRGTKRNGVGLFALAVVATAGLVALQLTGGPGVEKADISRRAASIARHAVAEVDGARLVQARAAFTRPELERYEDEVLLVSLMVERDGPGSDGALEGALRRAVRDRVAARIRGVTPLVDVTVLPGAE